MMPPTAFFEVDPPHRRPVYDIPPVVVTSPRWSGIRGFVSKALEKGGLPGAGRIGIHRGEESAYVQRDSIG